MILWTSPWIMKPSVDVRSLDRHSVMPRLLNHGYDIYAIGAEPVPESPDERVLLLHTGMSITPINVQAVIHGAHSLYESGLFLCQSTVLGMGSSSPLLVPDKSTYQELVLRAYKFSDQELKFPLLVGRMIIHNPIPGVFTRSLDPYYPEEPGSRKSKPRARAPVKKIVTPQQPPVPVKPTRSSRDDNDHDNDHDHDANNDDGVELV